MVHANPGAGINFNYGSGRIKPVYALRHQIYARHIQAQGPGGSNR